MLLPAIREMRQRATSWGGGQLHPLLRVSWLARPLSPRGQLCFPLDCPAKWWNSSLQHSAIRISYRYILHKWLRAKLLSLLEQRV